MVVGQYWSNTEALATLVGGEGATNGWQTAPVVLYAQIMQWYLVCGVYSIYFCNRGDLMGIGQARSIAVYAEEFASFKRNVQPICMSERFSCYVANNCYDAGQVRQLAPFNRALKQILQSEDHCALHASSYGASGQHACCASPVGAPAYRLATRAWTQGST